MKNGTRTPGELSATISAGSRLAERQVLRLLTRAPMRHVLTTLVLFAWIVVCSCRAEAGAGADGENSPAGTWTLTALEGADLGALARPAELTLGSDGTLAGFSGVNRFSGRVAPEELADGHLRASPLVSTRMAGPPEAMEIESRLLALLGTPLEWRREGAHLELLRDGAVVARFAEE